jgi:hypothetical protein
MSRQGMTGGDKGLSSAVPGRASIGKLTVTDKKI